MLRNKANRSHERYDAQHDLDKAVGHAFQSLSDIEITHNFLTVLAVVDGSASQARTINARLDDLQQKRNCRLVSQFSPCI